MAYQAGNQMIIVIRQSDDDRDQMTLTIREQSDDDNHLMVTTKQTIRLSSFAKGNIDE
jgi:hypothetical protein